MVQPAEQNFLLTNRTAIIINLTENCYFLLAFLAGIVYNANVDVSVTLTVGVSQPLRETFMSGHISALNETFTSERFAALNASLTAEAV